MTFDVSKHKRILTDENLINKRERILKYITKTEVLEDQAKLTLFVKFLNSLTDDKSLRNGEFLDSYAFINGDDIYGTTPFLKDNVSWLLLRGEVQTEFYDSYVQTLYDIFNYKESYSVAEMNEFFYISMNIHYKYNTSMSFHNFLKVSRVSSFAPIVSNDKYKRSSISFKNFENTVLMSDNAEEFFIFTDEERSRFIRSMSKPYLNIYDFTYIFRAIAENFKKPKRTILELSEYCSGVESVNFDEIAEAVLMMIETGLEFPMGLMLTGN